MSRSMALRAQESPGTDVQPGWNGSRDGAATAGHLHHDGAGPVRWLGRAVARTTVMHELFDTLDRLAPTDLNLVLLGETAVAKDLLGHAIHERSGRENGPYVVFDCHSPAASLDGELLNRSGRGPQSDGGCLSALGRARGGTLFLDRVDRLPRDLQSRLRWALDEQRAPRGNRALAGMDARVIAATNLDLSAEVTAGRFRKDLFYRLAGGVARVPALPREKNDILVLRTRVANDREPDIESFPLGGQSLWRLERAAIRQTLVEARGNKASAARSLGIALSTLYVKLQKHGL